MDLDLDKIRDLMHDRDHGKPYPCDENDYVTRALSDEVPGLVAEVERLREVRAALLATPGGATAGFDDAVKAVLVAAVAEWEP